jgi:hypothetical protein
MSTESTTTESISLVPARDLREGDRILTVMEGRDWESQIRRIDYARASGVLGITTFGGDHMVVPAYYLMRLVHGGELAELLTRR